MEIFLLVGVVLVIVIIAANIHERRQVTVESDLPPARARKVVDGAFDGPVTRLFWRSVPGPGQVNKERRTMHGDGPILSVAISASEGGGSRVKIWASSTQDRQFRAAGIGWAASNGASGMRRRVRRRLRKAGAAVPAPSGSQ